MAGRTITSITIVTLVLERTKGRRTASKAKGKDENSPRWAKVMRKMSAARWEKNKEAEKKMRTATRLGK